MSNSADVVIVTGASGLLGRAVYKLLSCNAAWQAVGLCYSRSSAGLIKVDLRDRSQVQELFEKYKPRFVVHCAAERRPDVVEKKADETKQLNVDATSIICEQAAKSGSTVLYMSTDYVFDGLKPPYMVTDEPHPLNKYGQSKLDGEKVVLQTSPDNLILRVPILYGEVERLDESAVTVLLSALLDTKVSSAPGTEVSPAPCLVSDYEIRYPTHCRDVAGVIQRLLERRLKDSELSGIFHWSGAESMTKYSMTLAIASAFNLPTNDIVADKQAPPPGTTTRPYDAHLDCSRLEELHLDCQRTPFVSGIKECLQPFIDKL